ncbi:MAG: hypothetical protein ACREIC_32565 [Limisphaerales bacterium]
MWIFLRRKRLASSAFSEFIRSASAREKKRVYTEVLKKATDRQNALIRRDSEGDEGRRIAI